MKILKNEFIRLSAFYKNYKFDIILGNLDIFLLCLGIYYGIAQNMFQNFNQFYIIIGMIIWRLATFSLGTICNSIQEETRKGTISQLILCKTNITKLLISRYLVDLFIELIQVFIITLLLIVLLNINIPKDINIILILYSIIMGVISFVGMAFILGGFAFKHKKVNALVNLVNYFILFFTGLILPLNLLPKFFSFISTILPFSKIINIIKYPTFNNEIIILTILSFIWLFIGILSFNIQLKKALKSGNISNY